MSAAAATVLVLGTGTSHGVPMIGCECDTCRSTDPRDSRSRASIYIQIKGGPSVLVDTTPDLRTQALTHGLKRVDAILYTHSHADHVMGLDEVRRFNALQKSASHRLWARSPASRWSNSSALGAVAASDPFSKKGGTVFG